MAETTVPTKGRETGGGAPDDRPSRGQRWTHPDNLPLRERRIDIFFAVIFVWFFVTSGISDLVPTLGIEMAPDSPNPLARWNWGYAHDADPLFMTPPVWMRFVTGLSAFVYGPLYLVMSRAFVKGWNWIQLPAVMYGTAISVITGVIVFGVEVFDPVWKTPNPAKFFFFNTPYVVIPILLIVRMRRELPFTRRF